MAWHGGVFLGQEPATGKNNQATLNFDSDYNLKTDWVYMIGVDYNDPDKVTWVYVKNGSIVSSIPEPGSLLALGSGVMMLAGIAIRRRR